MRFRILSMIVFFIAVNSFAQMKPLHKARKDSGSLFGNWESVNLRDSHLTLLKIERDSTFFFQKDLAENYSYKLTGTRMIRTLLDTLTGEKIVDTSFVRQTKDSLIISFPRKGKEKIISMFRIKGKRHRGKSIEGSYIWRYPGGRTAFSRFTKDGRWLFRLPLQTLKGRFSIYNSNIIFNFASKQGQFEKWMFFVKANRLQLKNNMTGSVEIYKRVDYFPEE